MAERIVMPSFGMYTAEGQLVEWLHPDGASVQAGEPVLEIETEKSTEAVIAPTAGVLRHVAPVGSQVKEEGLLGYILAPGEAVPGQNVAGPNGKDHSVRTSSALEPSQSSSLKSAAGSGRVIASPLARRRAKELGIDLARLEGSGPGGRIVERDVVTCHASHLPADHAFPLADGADFAVSTSVGTRGTIEKGLNFDSQTLGRSVRYGVYLPPGYEQSKRSYPVIYLLHGYGDTEMGWVQFGELDRIADEGIARRKFPPAILVMPDGGVNFYINNFDGSVRYEDFLVREFIPGIESRYRVQSGKGSRAVAGISMGGFGALALALRHQDLFTACLAFSAALHTEEDLLAETEAKWTRVFAPIFGPVVHGGSRMTEHFKCYSPLLQVKHGDLTKAGGLKLYLDCGDEDLFYRGNSQMHVSLRDRHFPHEYRVRGGGHNWSYWRAGLPEALQSLSSSFFW